jgi:hypothetical protein
MAQEKPKKVEIKIQITMNDSELIEHEIYGIRPKTTATDIFLGLAAVVAIAFLFYAILVVFS